MNHMRLKTTLMACALALPLFANNVWGQSSQSTSTQSTGLPTTRRSVELGMRNGVTFEHTIAKHWTMRYGIGEAIHWNFQPLLFGPDPEKKCENPYYSNCNVESKGATRIGFMGDYHGISPFVNVAIRWYARPGEAGDGFFAGFDLIYFHDSWKVALKPSKDIIKLSHTFMMSPCIGYNFRITDRLNIKTMLLPSFGVGYSQRTDSTYGIPTISCDFGVTYAF